MAPGLDITTSSVTDTMKDEFLHLETTTPAKLAAKKASLRTENSTAEEDIFSSSPTTTTTTTTTPPQNNITSSKLLQASPYTDRAHHLDLNTLTPPLQLFAQALTAMRSITPSYATAPYPSAFNWDSIVDLFSQAMQKEASISNSALPEEELSFYVIVFRSRVNATADRRLLGQLDKAAHLEAVDSGGLLKYWFGTPDADGRNLATCESFLLPPSLFLFRIPSIDRNNFPSSCFGGLLTKSFARLMARPLRRTTRRRGTGSCAGHASREVDVRRVVRGAAEVER